MHKAILFLLIGFPLLVSGQKFNSTQFEERVKCSVRLLNMSAESDMDKILPKGFELVKKEGTTYHLRDPQGIPITAYLHSQTLRVAYVSFTEVNSTFEEVKEFLTEEKKYEWAGTEHLWNYFNDKKIAIAISPEMIIHISKYDL